MKINLNRILSLIKFFLVIIMFYYTLMEKSYCQFSPAKDIFDYSSFFDNTIIEVSDRISEEWGLNDKFIAKMYYNAHLDPFIPKDSLPDNVFGYFFTPGDTSISLQLKDDGMHFDKDPGDGIYGDYLATDTSKIRKDEAMFIAYIGRKFHGYRFLTIPVNLIPHPPVITYPLHGSNIPDNMPDVKWTIDEIADGCGIIITSQRPKLGHMFDKILWEERYEKKGTTNFTVPVPFKLENNTEYNVIVWSFMNSKLINGSYNKCSYSMEWVTFKVDTTMNETKNFNVKNYPNPFSSETMIELSQQIKEATSITIFDILGKEVKKIINDEISSGRYFYTWDGKDNCGNLVSCGTYFLVARTAHNMKVVKLLIVR